MTYRNKKVWGYFKCFFAFILGFLEKVKIVIFFANIVQIVKLIDARLFSIYAKKMRSELERIFCIV